jgi:hypothetical protein
VGEAIVTGSLAGSPGNISDARALANAVVTGVMVGGFPPIECLGQAVVTGSMAGSPGNVSDARALGTSEVTGSMLGSPGYMAGAAYGVATVIGTMQLYAGKPGWAIGFGRSAKVPQSQGRAVRLLSAFGRNTRALAQGRSTSQASTGGSKVEVVEVQGKALGGRGR